MENIQYQRAVTPTAVNRLDGGGSLSGGGQGGAQIRGKPLSYGVSPRREVPATTITLTSNGAYGGKVAGNAIKSGIVGVRGVSQQGTLEVSGQQKP